MVAFELRSSTAPHRHRMTRIGFAYNQKPEQEAPRDGGELEAPRPDEEPPSSAATTGGALGATATALAAAQSSDEFA